MFLYLFWDITLFPQDEGFENTRTGRTAFPVQEIPDVIPPALHPERNRVCEILPQFYPPALLGQESNRINSIESKMAFVGKPARIMESSGRIESAMEPEAISYSKRGILSFKEDQQKALHGDGTVR
jgi:hypothetical protein